MYAVRYLRRKGFIKRPPKSATVSELVQSQGKLVRHRLRKTTQSYKDRYSNRLGRKDTKFGSAKRRNGHTGSHGEGLSNREAYAKYRRHGQNETSVQKKTDLSSSNEKSLGSNNVKDATSKQSSSPPQGQNNLSAEKKVDVRNPTEKPNAGDNTIDANVKQSVNLRKRHSNAASKKSENVTTPNKQLNGDDSIKEGGAKQPIAHRHKDTTVKKDTDVSSSHDRPNGTDKS